MSEELELNQARNLIATNNNDKAIKILWKLYESHNLKIKLDAILCLLVSLDHFTENIKLIKLTDEGLKIVATSGDENTKIYLVAEKYNFLQNKLGFFIYRQKNLKLSANVFKWINFSTEQEKTEFEEIEKQRCEIELEVQKLETIITDFLKTSNNHYLKGRIFMRLGDVYSSKLSNDQLDLMIGGKARCRIGNIYTVRSWNLDKWFLYKSKNRKKITDDKIKCFNFFRLAISEFESGKDYTIMAHAYYNLAVKYKFIFKFRKAEQALKQARDLAKKNNEELLFFKIDSLRKQLKDKNKNIRNYVEEFGLDLP